MSGGSDVSCLLEGSDVRRDRVGRPPGRWEEPLIEARGLDSLDTEQVWELAELADAINAK